MSADRVDMTEPPATPVGDPEPAGILDFLDGLPAGTRTEQEWAEFEREFQAERNAWERG